MQWKISVNQDLSRFLVKSFFFISILIVGCFLELPAQKGVDGLVQAEKNFAAWSVNHGTQEAFLKFLDSIGIIFENGKPVNGIETWNKRGNRPGILNWWPQFAEVSASGDFGYTTGSWTFRNPPADTIAARGQYTTVWRCNKQGQWKFLVDLGVSNTPPVSESGTTLIDVQKQTLVDLSLTSILSDPETRFLKAVAANKDKAYKEFLSKQSILNRNGIPPAIAVNAQKAAIDSTPSVIEYVTNGGSSNQDMMFVYGTTTISGKTDNYLRIWRRETDGWKIALEVLRY